ncbi:MAG: DUF47 domain-containing protein [Firmicutes bacterium]|nr:DUF47 domain-containing protein [Bacillota bacterium]
MGWNLKPKEDKFYELFRDSSEIVCSGATVLLDAMDEYERMPEKLVEINRLEDEGDSVIQTILDKLNQTFLTPFDREDIYTLARELDRILDHIHGTIEKMVLYRTGRPTSDVRELAAVLLKATEEIKQVILKLEDLKANYDQVLQRCEMIKQFENKGDHLYRLGVATLFDQVKDPIEVIKWKEVYEHLETALDHCEDVANLLKGVALKYA